MHMHIYIPEGKKKKARYGESGGDGRWTAETSKYQGTKVSEKKRWMEGWAKPRKKNCANKFVAVGSDRVVREWCAEDGAHLKP